MVVIVHYNNQLDQTNIQNRDAILIKILTNRHCQPLLVMRTLSAFAAMKAATTLHGVPCLVPAHMRSPPAMKASHFKLKNGI
jgi:hypothetical protein